MTILDNLLKRIWVQQFIKYFIAGCIATAVDMAALHLFYKILHVPIKLSVVLGFLNGNIASFLLNKYFTFRNLSTAIFRQYLKYFLTSITGLLWTLLLMTLFFESWNWFAGITQYNYLVCKMLVALIVMFWNFVIIRHWTLANYEIKLSKQEIADKQVYLSIIIPAYNEQNRLPATVRTIDKWLEAQNFTYELLIVDDGSTDNMISVIKTEFSDLKYLKLYSLSKNMGKGAAVRAGMLAAEGEYCLFMDADHQISINELNVFLPRMNDKSVLIGSKYLHDKNVAKNTNIPLARVIVSRLGNLIIRLLLNINSHDTQCGFKLFPAQVAKDVFRLQKITGFAFDIEVLALVKLYNIEIVEIPVVVHDAVESRVRTIYDSVRVFFDILRIKLNIWKKVYNSLTTERSSQNYTINRLI